MANDSAPQRHLHLLLGTRVQPSGKLFPFWYLSAKLWKKNYSESIFPDLEHSKMSSSNCSFLQGTKSRARVEGLQTAVTCLHPFCSSKFQNSVSIIFILINYLVFSYLDLTDYNFTLVINQFPESWLAGTSTFTGIVWIVKMWLVISSGTTVV